MTHYLLEDPWPVMVVLGVAALGLALVGQRRAERRLMLAAGAAVGLAGLTYLTARLVVTDREELMQRTEALVRATAPLDAAALAALLGPEAQLGVPGDGQVLTRAQMLQEVGQAAGRGVQGHQITTLDGKVEAEGRGRTFLQIQTRIEGQVNVEVPTSWELVWERGPGGWVVRDVILTRFMGQQPTFGIWR